MKENDRSFDKQKATDEVLVEMLQEDSGPAFKTIYDRYHETLFRIAMGTLKDESLSKDLVQNVFIDLWSRRQTSNIRNLPHYLTRAIKFQILKELRDGKLRTDHIALFENLRFANQTADSIDSAELEAVLTRAVESLPPRCREIFILSRYDDLSHKEIASRLNISPKTVEGQIGKALAFLREKLDKAVLLFPAIFF